jgi:hypothetical protein
MQARKKKKKKKETNSQQLHEPFFQLPKSLIFKWLLLIVLGLNKANLSVEKTNDTSFLH